MKPKRRARTIVRASLIATMLSVQVFGSALVLESAQQVKTVPGFTVTKMQESLRGLGFTCKGPKTSQTTRIWNCEKGFIYKVDLIADSSGNLLNTSIYTFPMRGFDLNSVRSTLASIASIRYQGAAPDRVTKWVNSGVGAARAPEDLNVGGVVFSLLVTNPPNLTIAVEEF